MNDNTEQQPKYTLKSINASDFILSFGDSFFSKIKGYFKASKRDNTTKVFTGIVKHKRDFLLKAEENQNVEVVFSDDEIINFIEKNIALAVDTVLYYEIRLGNIRAEESVSLKRIVLDITASRIVLALGANSQAEENLVKRERDIIEAYEDRLKALPKKGKGDELLPLGEKLDFTPQGKSLVTNPNFRRIDVY